jgi:hypothetical protein
MTMAHKIFKLVLIRGFTEAYYQLPEEENRKLHEAVHAAVEKAGAKVITPHYNCRWSNDQYASFFLMEFPDIESAIGNTADGDQVNLFRYIVGESILGIDPGGET